MPVTKASAIFFEEKVLKIECLSCGEIWTPRVLKPRRCVNCNKLLVIQDVPDDIIPLVDAHQKNKVATK